MSRNILDELAALGPLYLASKPLLRRAVDRMKRDRATINRMRDTINWYDRECRRFELELEKRPATIERTGSEIGS
jgi:hypothetical protein